MTQKEKCNYMMLAMRLAGFNINDEGAAIVVELYESVLMYNGNVNMKQIITIQNNMAYCYKKEENNQ